MASDPVLPRCRTGCLWSDHDLNRHCRECNENRCPQQCEGPHGANLYDPQLTFDGSERDRGSRRGHR